MTFASVVTTSRRQECHPYGKIIIGGRPEAVRQSDRKDAGSRGRKIRKLGEKITIHRRRRPDVASCAHPHARPPPFTPHARSSPAGERRRRQAAPTGTPPCDLITTMIGENGHRKAPRGQSDCNSSDFYSDRELHWNRAQDALVLFSQQTAQETLATRTSIRRCSDRYYFDTPCKMPW